MGITSCNVRIGRHQPVFENECLGVPLAYFYDKYCHIGNDEYPVDNRKFLGGYIVSEGYHLLLICVISKYMSPV